MRHIGFSTGALALADFRTALKILAMLPLDAVELSALREHELFPLLDSFDDLDLREFRYVSIHAPSQISRKFEAAAAGRLAGFAARGVPIVVHPDAISDWDLWSGVGQVAGTRCVVRGSRAWCISKARASTGDGVGVNW